MSLLKPTSPELPRLEAANGQPITPVQLAALISAGPTGLPAPRPKRALHPAAVLSVWKFHIEMRPIAIHRHPSPSIAIHRHPSPSIALLTSGCWSTARSCWLGAATLRSRPSQKEAPQGAASGVGGKQYVCTYWSRPALECN
jgi:hypothetical protein